MNNLAYESGAALGKVAASRAVSTSTSPTNVNYAQPQQPPNGVASELQRVISLASQVRSQSARLLGTINPHAGSEQLPQSEPVGLAQGLSSIGDNLQNSLIDMEYLLNHLNS